MKHIHRVNFKKSVFQPRSNAFLVPFVASGLSASGLVTTCKEKLGPQLAPHLTNRQALTSVQFWTHPVACNTLKRWLVSRRDRRQRAEFPQRLYFIIRLLHTLPHTPVIHITFLFHLQACKLLESQVSDLYLLQRMLKLGPRWVEDYIKWHDLQMAGSELEFKCPYAICQSNVLFLPPLLRFLCYCITNHPKDHSWKPQHCCFSQVYGPGVWTRLGWAVLLHGLFMGSLTWLASDGMGWQVQ